MEQVDWDIALHTFVDRMKTIQQVHGPHSVAFLSTGQIVTEEMALLGALAKFGMSMLHGDWQYPAVHGDSGNGLQGIVRFRCAALYVRRF